MRQRYVAEKKKKKSYSASKNVCLWQQYFKNLDFKNLDFVNDVTTPKERRKKSSDSFPLLYFFLSTTFL